MKKNQKKQPAKTKQNASLSDDKPRKGELTIDQKYVLYEKAVQSVDFEMDFIDETFQKIFRKKAKTLQEDFCGTGLIACEWVKRHQNNEAVGVDLDETPVGYGKRTHYADLDEEEQERMKYIIRDVCIPGREKKDVVLAFNFSYFIFKERAQLLKYFKNVKQTLNPQGLFLLDAFGGLECHQRIVDKVDHKNFIYYWDCDEYNPINHHCLYKIHFKMKDTGKKYNDVFTYDWRMWTLPEISDVLKDAGFKNVDIYWEGDDENGAGNGQFEPTTEAENCESWICYIAAY